MEELIALLRALGFEIEGDDLSGLSDEDLAAAETALQEQYTEARNERDIERAEELVGAVGAVRTEAEARLNAAAEVDERLAQLDGEIAGETTEPGDGEGGEGEGEEGDGASEGEGAPAGDGEAEEGEGQETDAAAPVPVAATARTPVARTESRAIIAAMNAQNRAAAQQRRMPTAPASRQAAPSNQRRSVITAGANLNGFDHGQRIDDVGVLGEAVADRIDALLKASRAGGTVPKFSVASVNVEDLYPAERRLGRDESLNRERINAAVAAAQAIELAVILASGGLCAPVNVSYDLFGVGNDRRPLRDAFLRFGATRGGIRRVTSPTLADIDDAIAVWTEANDTNPTDPTTKPCQVISCGDPIEDVIEAITKCLQVGNFQRRTFPENFADFWRLAGIAHARLAEIELWDAFTAAAIAPLTDQTVLGVSRDVPANLARAAQALRNRHRELANTTIRVIAPEVYATMHSVDRLRQLPGDQATAVAMADIQRELGVHNIAVTWSPDIHVEAAQLDGQPLNGWPSTLEFGMHFEGSELFLDAGQLDFGMEIRDSTLNATNDVQAFMETFEGHASLFESLHLTMDVCVSGATSATEDITPAVCVSGS